MNGLAEIKQANATAPDRYRVERDLLRRALQRIANGTIKPDAVQDYAQAELNRAARRKG